MIERWHGERTMYEVHGTPTTRTTRVTWTLEEIGADWRFVRVDLRAGEHREEPFRRLNPSAKVPVLVAGDVTISESLAICSWLAERHPDAGLAPGIDDAATRADYLRWCAFVVTELEQPLWTIAKHSFALPEAYRVAGIAETARFEFARAAAVLARGLDGREVLAGDRFSIADVLASHTLRWARNVLGELGHAALEAYADRHLARPALARARDRETA